jgi:endonuclease/exonuclease/phosphatase family metal-dependent hydrolase
MKDLKTPASFLVMGDFNDMPGSDIHRILTDFESGLLDSWQALDKGEDQMSMTHHDFRGIPGKCRMDWILVSEDFQVKEARVIRDSFGGRYPSDHFPYVVELDWVEV